MSFRAVETLRGWCRKETDEHSSLRRTCVCQERNPSSTSVIPSEVEESGRQLRESLTFEARFLRYVMLRITPVGMTTCNVGFFGPQSMFLLGAIQRIARQSQTLGWYFCTRPFGSGLGSENDELRVVAPPSPKPSALRLPPSCNRELFDSGRRRAIMVAFTRGGPGRLRPEKQPSEPDQDGRPERR